MPVSSVKSSLAVLAVLLAAVCLAPPSSAQTTLYGQPAYSLGQYQWNADFSSSNGITVIQNGTTYGPFGPYLSYDNFVLTSTSQIGSVTWEGLTIADPSFGLGHQGVEPSTFTIDFLSNNSGLPGSVINSQTVSPTTTYCIFNRLVVRTSQEGAHTVRP
jgi:hypothetical protein